MKPSAYTTMPLIISGLALCLVSLYMLRTNQPVAKQPPVLLLPTSNYQADSPIEGWMLPGYMPLPPRQVTATDTAQVAPSEPVSDSPIVRVRVPRVGIDAPVDIRGVDSGGAMQDPEGPVTVAWYDFSARPGTIGNVVMAGHVDYHDYGPAVFWNLRNLEPGDRVEVSLADGQTYIYEVDSLNYYTAADAPVDEIVGATDYEALTMITCGGSFNPSQLEYDKRLVVRAKRVTSTASLPSDKDWSTP